MNTSFIIHYYATKHHNFLDYFTMTTLKISQITMIPSFHQYCMHAIKTLIFIISETGEKHGRSEAHRRLQHNVISRGSIKVNG